MRRWLVLGLSGLLLGGCAWMGRMRQDYQTGRQTPLAQGEVAPHAQAVQTEQPFETLPYGQFARLAVPLLTVFFTYLRGRRIRKKGQATAQPATGVVGIKLGLEWLVQSLANVSTGALEWGPDGSPLKRALKVAGVIGVGLLTTAASSPEAAQFVATHAGLLSVLTTISAVVGALEKALSHVQPTLPSSQG